LAGDEALSNELLVLELLETIADLMDLGVGGFIGSRGGGVRGGGAVSRVTLGGTVGGDLKKG
jgi:hypothetical protein